MKSFYVKIGDAVTEAGIRVARIEAVYDDGGVQKVVVEYARPDGERRTATLAPSSSDGLDLMNPDALE